MKILMTINRLILLGILLSTSALILPASSYAWSGESWESITRATIESRATMMMKNTWTPKNTISNWGYRSTYHTFSKGTTYTGMAYTQNNPQETWSEFLNLVKNTSGGKTGYGTDCSGFASIAWKLPSRYSTSIFESDATQSGGYVKSLGATGSGQNASLEVGDALNRASNHIILFKKRTSGGIISMEQTPWTARSREWTWSQLSKYRPIRRYNIKSGETSDSITGKVSTNGGSLNVRTGPSTGYTVVDSLANGTKVTIQCRVSGQSTTGKLGTTKRWYLIGSKKYVSAAYISTSSSVPACE